MLSTNASINKLIIAEMPACTVTQPLAGKSDSLAGQAYLNICHRVMGEDIPLLDLAAKNSFWAKFINLFKKN